MDDADLQMMERSSQAGSITGMEVEGDTTVRDADMEIHDMDAEGSVEEMPDAIAEDEDMAAEMHEQEQLQAEREWRVPDVDLTVIPEEAVIEHKQEDSTTHTALEEGGLVDNIADTAKDGQSGEDVPQASNEVLSPPGQPTLEEVVSAETDPDTEDQRESDGNEVDQYTTSEKPQQDATAENEPKVSEPHEQAEAEQQASKSPEAPQNGPLGTTKEANGIETGRPEDYPAEAEAEELGGSESSLRRPVLQKDYLAHVNVFTDALDADAQKAAPHVSLIFDNLFFSLFRPSSYPSGDDEVLLFGDEATEHRLYYESLEILIDSLHKAFPELKGDGDNELILDFGILDMQISEDNIYAQQLSLFDFDRIRIGMCQPELDRLQVNVSVGKRFVYRFNELAEHCYRMYADSNQDDSGTAYEEAYEGDDKPQANLEEDYSPNEAAVKDHSAAGSDKHKDPQIIIDLQEYEKSSVDGEEPTREDYSEGRDDVDGEEGVHPPTDEYYEDPEFAAEDNEEYPEVKHSETANEPEDDEVTLQGNLEEGEFKSEQSEEVQEEVVPIVDSDVPLDEAAQFDEEYDEVVVEAEKSKVEGNEVALHTDNERLAEPYNTEPETQYYHILASPTNEEVIYLDLPATNGQDAEGVHATVLNEVGEVQAEADTDPARNLNTKRSWDEIDLTQDDEEEDETVENTIASLSGSKRPKIAN